MNDQQFEQLCEIIGSGFNEILVALEKLDKPRLIVEEEALPRVKRLLHVLAKDYDAARGAIIGLGGFAAGENTVMDGNQWSFVGNPAKLDGLAEVEIMVVPGFTERSNAQEILDRLMSIRLIGSVRKQECPMNDDEVRKAVQEAYRRGHEDGLRCFAHWKDGTQYVGTGGTTLTEALRRREESGYYLPPTVEQVWPVAP